MKYTIELEYQTGDTFQSYCTTDRVEITWENLEVAKEALRRIENHEKAYQKADSAFASKEDKEAYKNIPGYVEGYSILLPLDDGSEQKIYTFWQGYFEKLIGGEIVSVDEKEKGRKFRI